MSEEGSSPIGTSTHGASFLATSVNHPRLLRSDAQSVRIFLRLYDQYKNEVTAWAQQLTASDSTTVEPVRPVNLKFCVDPEYLESAIALDLIPNVDSYEELTDTVLRNFLNEKALESKQTISLDTLDSLVQSELRMDMTDKNARSRIDSLFVSYITLLRRSGLSWVTQVNQKVAVEHVLSAVRPKSLRERLESDLGFAYHDLKNDFKGFMKHARTVSDAFQVVDIGPKGKKDKDNRDGKGSNKNRSGGNSDKSEPSGNSSTSSTSGKSRKSARPLPFCPHGPCKEQGLPHLIKDCPTATDDEKKQYLAELAAKKAADGPASSTRSRKDEPTSSTTDRNSGRRVAGRIPMKENKSVTEKTTDTKPSCAVTVSDGQASIDCYGRCDDGSDDSIVSPALAERAVVRGIGKMTAIRPVTLSVTLKTGTNPQTFSFSRSWTSPRTVLHLSSGQLALANVTFLVADDDLACEDFPIGLPVLQHLQVDTRTLLENNRAVLDGSDCSNIGNPTTLSRGGAISRMMVARINRVQDPIGNTENSAQPNSNRPRVNYHIARKEEDPFPDQSLLDPLDLDQEPEIRNGIETMKNTAQENSLPKGYQSVLSELIESHINIFRTGFSAGPASKFQPMRIDLVPDARPVKVRLRNYSQEQRAFLKKFVDDLVRTGMAYPNPTSPWACAPLLVPKPGPAKFRFTVDLRPVNKFTVRHQFPMPNLEHEITKLSESRYYAIFDLSHGYWQLSLEKQSQGLQSFITPDGVYSPTRVLHGTTNAVSIYSP